MSREAQRVIEGEAVQELRRLATTFTEFAARLSGQIVNNVLDVQTQQFGTDPVIAKEYGAAAGAVTVTNLSAAGVVTVTSAGPAGAAPTVGTGVYKVPAGQTVTVPLASHQVTLYGTAADYVSFSVFTAAARPVCG